MYNTGMTRCTSLLLALAVAPLCPAQSAPAPVVVDNAQLTQQLQAVLRDMVKAGSEDFYEAAALVLRTTGDESAFLPLMEKAAAAGSSAAQYWVAMRKLPFTGADAASMAEVTRLVDRGVNGKYSPALVLASQLKAQTDAQTSRSLLMQACGMGNAKARALYLLQSGRLSAGNFTLPEIASELKKKNHYLEEIIASLQTNEQESLKWMRAAMEHGSATAPYILSQVVLPHETELESLKRLKFAAERHNVMAMFLYGIALMSADQIDCGIQANPEEGIRLIQIAAMLGSPEAASQLAMYYALGKIEGVTVERIYKLFEYSHLCGLAEGTAGVGLCKVLGAGCKADVDTGVQMMLAARDKGALWVNQALASVYYHGYHGMKPDMERTMNYLAADAAQDSVYAYAIAAGLSALGNTNTPPNPSMAEFYLKEALNRMPAYADQIQRAYDAIIATKSWHFAPWLEKAVSSPQN